MFKLNMKEIELNHDMEIKAGGVIIIEDKCWLVTLNQNRELQLTNMQCMETIQIDEVKSATIKDLMQLKWFWFADFNNFKNGAYDVRYIEPQDVKLSMKI
jgi:hypothetical protein